MANFIEVNTVLQGNISINVDNISSVKPNMGSSIITLKEIKDGKSVEIYASGTYEQVMRAIDYFNK